MLVQAKVWETKSKYLLVLLRRLRVNHYSKPCLHPESQHFVDGHTNTSDPFITLCVPITMWCVAKYTSWIISYPYLRNLCAHVLCLMPLSFLRKLILIFQTWVYHLDSYLSQFVKCPILVLSIWSWAWVWTCSSIVILVLKTLSMFLCHWHFCWELKLLYLC